ncbi:bifunctional 2',3'-cyclic-nucleotide 2'-phosphodiesterase/3'-nucleotidase [Aliidiomarina soli]|uniref:Bifunctional 2',3'-cyclic-nucleotide 2'-phosphodiesterase/3'-nucleotidase n=1 Tax=Aliidiomarina soli TaxID=1928574 RepID=A0A432WIR4_9GAMM|nr:bifunctional 2',3'-cyclic-nucleotide 2'-phosphodiesterase/3'-nucleotidase [Aliidiomarina soli]RUO33716.1 bifunctional 2',3'-cyclic-nucleotide 2'-phosphodiesterase/3'-nucleotidase [Aliidiomarina soli]
MKSSLFIASVVTGAILVSACATTQGPAPGTSMQVRLMQTTDLHAYMKGYDYFAQQPTSDYGLAHTAVLIEQARSESANSVLIDNGDVIQGSALGDYVAGEGVSYLTQQTHPVIAALNTLQYDVANLGNHEFNFGLEFLQATLSQADFPFISANTFIAPSAESSGKQDVPFGSAEPLVEPYVILQRDFVASDGRTHQLNIGVIGFVPPQIMNWDAHHLDGKIQVQDMVKAAEHYIPLMREQGADIVVAVPHSGLQNFDHYPQFAEQASLQLAKVAGIDVILFGHQHRVFPGASDYDDLPGVDNDGGYIHGVPAVQPGYWGSHLGLIDLQLRYDQGWQVAGSQVSLREIDERTHAQVDASVANAHSETLQRLNQPVASLQTPLRNHFAMVTPELTVQLINEAQQTHGETLQQQGILPTDLPVLSAAAPFRNGSQGSSDYTSIAAGELTLGNLSDLYVYPNTLQVVRVNGAQLRDWLEMSARAYEQISMQPESNEWLLREDVASYNFDIIRGVTYEIQPHHPARFNADGELIHPRHHRVYNLRYQGLLVSRDDEFLVVTNNYRASGGGNFPHLDGSLTVYQSAEQTRQLVADYLRRQAATNEGVLAPELDIHWHLALPRGARALMQSAGSAAAREEAAQLRDIEHLPDYHDHEFGEGFAVYRVLP